MIQELSDKNLFDMEAGNGSDDREEEKEIKRNAIVNLVLISISHHPPSLASRAPPKSAVTPS
jgi:hypothetical protein